MHEDGKTHNLSLERIRKLVSVCRDIPTEDTPKATVQKHSLGELDHVIAIPIGGRLQGAGHAGESLIFGAPLVADRCRRILIGLIRESRVLHENSSGLDCVLRCGNGGGRQTRPPHWVAYRKSDSRFCGDWFAIDRAWMPSCC